MTDKKLNEHYLKHASRYKALAKCTSVPEIMLKMKIYGYKWSQWDWMLLFTCIMGNSADASPPVKAPGERYDNTLFEDMLCTIDDSDMLDDIVTRKDVILSFIYSVNSRSSLHYVQHVRKETLALLAHVFKKFPKLWTMSWMFAKSKDQSRHGKWKKYHRLASSAAIEGVDSMPSNASRFYDKFISKYF